MFVGTNIDDIVVLTVLFLSARAIGRPRPWQIWAGQYLGIATLVVVSVVAALGLSIVPDRWVGLLGLVPLALGVRGLIRANRDRGNGVEGDAGAAFAGGLLTVGGVTIANGADNISVYTPVFRSVGVGAIVLTVAVFAVGVAVWCVVGSWLGAHRKIVRFVQRYGRWLVPVVFVAIGLVIVGESGVLARLFRRT